MYDRRPPESRGFLRPPHFRRTRSNGRATTVRDRM